MTINGLTPLERKLLFWIRLSDALPAPVMEPCKEMTHENYQGAFFAVSPMKGADDT